MRCSCQRSIVSTPSRRRLAFACWIRYSGRPRGVHWFGPVRVRPALVATRISPIGMQRLADQLLGNVGAVGIGGVDESRLRVRATRQRREAPVAVGGLAPNARPGDPHRAEAQPMHGRYRRRSRTLPISPRWSCRRAPDFIETSNMGRDGNRIASRGFPSSPRTQSPSCCSTCAIGVSGRMPWPRLKTCARPAKPCQHARDPFVERAAAGDQRQRIEIALQREPRRQHRRRRRAARPRCRGRSPRARRCRRTCRAASPRRAGRR